MDEDHLARAIACQLANNPPPFFPFSHRALVAKLDDDGDDDDVDNGDDDNDNDDDNDDVDGVDDVSVNAELDEKRLNK